METEKTKTCCFTGHRPSALTWRYTEKNVDFVMFRYRMRSAIGKAIDEGYVHFISGMAQGIDTICAEIVLDYKRENPSITLECAVPCINQCNGWSDEGRIRYEEILSKADKVTFVTKEEYADGCMKKRNEYMINKSSLLIAGFNGKIGGTAQTIKLAQKNGLKVVIIKP